MAPADPGKTRKSMDDPSPATPRISAPLSPIWNEIVEVGAKVKPSGAVNVTTSLMAGLVFENVASSTGGSTTTVTVSVKPPALTSNDVLARSLPVIRSRSSWLKVLYTSSPAAL